jgi:hypothetical protein
VAATGSTAELNRSVSVNGAISAWFIKCAVLIMFTIQSGLIICNLPDKQQRFYDKFKVTNILL